MNAASAYRKYCRGKGAPPTVRGCAAMTDDVRAVFFAEADSAHLRARARRVAVRRDGRRNRRAPFRRFRTASRQLRQTHR